MRLGLRLYFFVWLPALGTFLLLFQNCTSVIMPGADMPAVQLPAVTADDSDPAQLIKTGVGYQNTTYINVHKSSDCADGVQAVIVKDGDYYRQTVKNCRPQAAVDVTDSIEIMEHNPLVLFSNDILFEVRQIAGKAPSMILCRQVASSQYEGQKAHTDFAAQTDGKGYIITGRYNAQGRIAGRAIHRLQAVMKEASAAGSLTYVDKTSGEKFTALASNCRKHTP